MNIPYLVSLTWQNKEREGREIMIFVSAAWKNISKSLIWKY
jgi:hypothetical protein